MIRQDMFDSEDDPNLKTPQETRKGKHLKRMKEKYPDRNLDDDEELFGAIGDDYDEYDEKVGAYEKEFNSMRDLLKNDPRSGQFLTDMHEGKSPWASYIRLYGPELKDMLDDPDTIDQIAEAEREYKERVAQSQKADEEYEANIKQTIQMLEGYKTSRGMDDDAIDDVLAAAIGIVRDGIVGKFTEDTLDMICKALNHDKDVAEANETGRIAGRNDRINERLKTSQKGDGTVPLGGKSNTAGGNKYKSIFDLAAEAR